MQIIPKYMSGNQEMELEEGTLTFYLKTDHNI